MGSRRLAALLSRRWRFSVNVLCRPVATVLAKQLQRKVFSADWDDWDETIADRDDIIPVTPCHREDNAIIAMDGGWLPNWDEALDESIKINTVYLTTQL